MNFYQGQHAKLYDLFYSDKSYRTEAHFIHECLLTLSHKPTNRLLELACGTGSHAIQFAKLGYQVTATDCSPSMLSEARKKADAEGVKI